ncbi:MAG: hypothetical protein IJZ87_08385 [Bacteroidales bacterium]|nr:hypothetical protein [Bacteroidales bacterium]
MRKVFTIIMLTCTIMMVSCTVQKQAEKYPHAPKVKSFEFNSHPEGAKVVFEGYSFFQYTWIDIRKF